MYIPENINKKKKKYKKEYQDYKDRYQLANSQFTCNKIYRV